MARVIGVLGLLQGTPGTSAACQLSVIVRLGGGAPSLGTVARKRERSADTARPETSGRGVKSILGVPTTLKVDVVSTSTE